MAFDIKPKWSGQDGGRQSSDGKTGSQESARVFTLVSDSPTTDTDVDAQYAPGLPILREPHPQNIFLRCSNISVRRLSPILFEVTCSYAAPTYSNDQNSGNPLDQPADVRFFPVKTSVKFDRDMNGKPYVNVNNEPFEPYEKPWNDLGIAITKNLAVFDPAYMSTYLAEGGATNSDEFLGLPVGTCHIENFTADTVANEDSYYWRVHLEVHVRRGYGSTTDEKAWYHRVCNEGFLYRMAMADTADKWVKVIGAKPVLLKNGVSDKGEKEDNPDNAVWLEFPQYPSLPFAPLGIW